MHLSDWWIIMMWHGCDTQEVTVTGHSYLQMQTTISVLWCSIAKVWPLNPSRQWCETISCKSRQVKSKRPVDLLFFFFFISHFYYFIFKSLQCLKWHISNSPHTFLVMWTMQNVRLLSFQFGAVSTPDNSSCELNSTCEIGTCAYACLLFWIQIRFV